MARSPRSRSVWFPLAGIVAALAILVAGVASAQTADEAKAFFKDLDDHTIDAHQGLGNLLLGQIYGADAVRKLWDDINAFQSAAGLANRAQILDANGKPVPADLAAAVTAATNAVVASGALQRLSDLQIRLTKKHFGDPPDHAKVQRAYEMFANGELRGGNGVRDMNSTMQWLIWKRFAEVAIQRDIDKAFWEKMLKTLQKSLEIFRQTHPASAAGAAPFFGELMGESSDFDPDLQLTEAQKAAKRAEIDALTTAQILARQKNLINDMTTAQIDPRPGTTEFASISPQANPNGSFNVNVTVSVRDSLGQPRNDAQVSVWTTDIGLALPMDSFTDLRMATPLGGGLYGIGLSVPSVHVGLSFHAHDATTLAGATTGQVLRQAPASVPGLGRWGAVVLAIALLAGAWWTLSRRRAARG